MFIVNTIKNVHINTNLVSCSGSALCAPPEVASSRLAMTAWEGCDDFSFKSPRTFFNLAFARTNWLLEFSKIIISSLYLR